MSEPTGVSTGFGLLRHGQTIWNRQKRIQGRLDSSLTADGIKTIREWAGFLESSRWSWNRIITSPAQRARETAMIINEKLDLGIQEDTNLREQDWGLWEGLTRSEISEKYLEILNEQVKRGWSFRPPQGESRLEVSRRVQSALSSYGNKYPGEHILIITHQGVIKSLIYFIEKRQFQPNEPKLINKNSLQTIKYQNNAFSRGIYNISI